jgi:hypothetical protein
MSSVERLAVAISLQPSSRAAGPLSASATRAYSSMDAMVELTRLRDSKRDARARGDEVGRQVRTATRHDRRTLIPQPGDNLWGSQNSVRHERNRGFTGGAQVSAPRTGSRVQVARTVNL